MSTVFTCWLLSKIFSGPSLQTVSSSSSNYNLHLQQNTQHYNVWRKSWHENCPPGEEVCRQDLPCREVSEWRILARWQMLRCKYSLITLNFSGNKEIGFELCNFFFLNPHLSDYRSSIWCQESGGEWAAIHPWHLGMYSWRLISGHWQWAKCTHPLAPWLSKALTTVWS